MAGRTRTIFLGSGPFALPSLAALTRGDLVEVVAVVTAPPRPAGRHGEPRPTPVGEAASRSGLPTLVPVTLRTPQVVATLAASRPELMVLADYGRIVPAAVLALPGHGALNLHPSLLPRHRGASPVAAAILAGDDETGVTLMRMDEGLDTGPIIASATVPLAGDETAPRLEARLADLAATLLADALPAWLAGSLAAVPQPDAGATLTRPLRREDGRIRPDLPAANLERQVRAYQPWPGSFLDLGGERLILWRASLIAAEPSGDTPTAPGALVPVGEDLALVTGSGWLRLDEVQPAGRGRMSGAAYRRGLRSGLPVAEVGAAGEP